MPFFEQNKLTSSTSFDERKWVAEIRKTLDEEIEEETDQIPVTIFAVPKTLFISDPDSYTPQEVAIGPYHHLRAELYDMETYKVAAAKRNQGELKNLKLQHIVAHLSKLELKIRACYHRPLSFGSEALAWMMAVDVSFLFEFFEVCGVRKGKVLTKVPSRLAHLISLSGRNTTHNAILRDIMMLENQIPLFAIKMLLKFQFSSDPDEVLLDMLMELSKEVSPFKMAEAAWRKIDVNDCAHLLDFLYRFIVSPPPMKSDVLPASDATNIDLLDEEEGRDQKEDHEKSKTPFSEPSHLRQLLHELWRILSRLSVRPMRLLKRIIFSGPVKVFVKLPWTILSKIPVIKLLKDPAERMLTFLQHGKEKNESSSSNSTTNKLPLLEEIKIPSVTQLSQVGVQFVPIHEGITSIKFDVKTLTFYIPIIDLDVNSEVVLRNLVAYEACSASGPLVLTRYVELMNGIIDTDSDARFLCGREIIINHLKSEKEVVELWNGMSKSIRLTKVPPLDDLIGEVNKYYKGRWKVKLGRFMKKYVFASWRILTFLATVLLLMLMSLQAFCQVYNCTRLFRIKALEPVFTPQ